MSLKDLANNIQKESDSEQNCSDVFSHNKVLHKL